MNKTILALVLLLAGCSQVNDITHPCVEGIMLSPLVAQCTGTTKGLVITGSTAPVTQQPQTPATDTLGLSVSGSLSANEGDTLNLQLSGTSSLLRGLSYSCTFGCNHPGITLDPVTGAMVWNISYSQSGVYNMIFRISDGALTLDLPVTLTINVVDQTPMFQNLQPQTVSPGQPVTLTPQATEANGQALTYYLTSTLPANASWDGTTLTFTPDGSQIGDVEFDFQASDGSDVGTGALIVSVQ